MITVKEHIYEKLADGRTVLAAAPGDELTAEDAKRLSVTDGGKAGSGSATPPTSLDDMAPDPGAPAGPPVIATQTEQALTEVTPTPEPPADLAVDLSGNAKDTIAAIKNDKATFDAGQLDALETAENARSGDVAPRATVLKAIAARREALS